MTKDTQNSEHTPVALRVLKRIEEGRVTQIPSWRFLFMNTAFWTLWGIAVLAGAATAAFIVAEMADAEYAYRFFANTAEWSFLLASVPYVWVVALLALGAVSFAAVHATRHGYRYPFVRLVVASVIMSSVLGTVLYAAGVDSVNETVADVAPRSVITLTNPSIALWNDPSGGRLVGNIVAIDRSAGNIELRAIDRTTWTILMEDAENETWDALLLTERLRLLGRTVSEEQKTFTPCIIIPWAKVRGERNFFVIRSTDCEGLEATISLPVNR